MIQARFLSRGLPMSESNRKQASVLRSHCHPFGRHGSRFLTYSTGHPGGRPPRGTLGVEADGRRRWNRGAEALRPNETGAPRAQSVRRIRTFGIGESMLAEMLGEFDWHDLEATIGTCAHLDGVTIIVRGRATPAGESRLTPFKDAYSISSATAYTAWKMRNYRY